MRVSYVCVLCRKSAKQRIGRTQKSSASSDLTEDPNAEFTWPKMCHSFSDPSCGKFVKSLNAEMTARPYLALMTPDKADKIMPDPKIFNNGGRRYVQLATLHRCF